MDGVRLRRVRRPAGLRPVLSHARRPATDFNGGRHPATMAAGREGALLPRARPEPHGGNRDGGRACGAPSPLCGSVRKRVQSSRFEPHNGLRFVADCAAKKWPCGQPAARSLRQSKLLPPRRPCVVASPAMADRLSNLYQDLLDGTYDCADRIVLNAYFRPGHSGGGFRVWWRQLTGSDDPLDTAHLMRVAGRFRRRLRAYCKQHGIPVIDCAAGERKHELAEQHLATTTVTEGVFLILVGKAQAPVWEVGGTHHLERKRPMPYVNHYSFQILDRDWGHLTIKISGHPPFPAQIMLNGHEWVACQARTDGIRFTKEGNCFTHISDIAGFARLADTLSDPRTIGRLREVCERWIYSACLCFALESDEQHRSGFRYQYSNYQLEYSRNLVFTVGGRMDQVFQALIDRTRTRMDLRTVRTILGYRRRPRCRPRRGKHAPTWEVTVERPVYDLTIFKLDCDRLTLKIYTKGERVLRVEAM